MKNPLKKKNWEYVTIAELRSHWDINENATEENKLSDGFIQELAPYMNAYAYGDIAGEGLSVFCPKENDELVAMWNDNSIITFNDMHEYLEEKGWVCHHTSSHFTASKNECTAHIDGHNCKGGYLTSISTHQNKSFDEYKKYFDSYDDLQTLAQMKAELNTIDKDRLCLDEMKSAYHCADNIAKMFLGIIRNTEEYKAIRNAMQYIAKGKYIDDNCRPLGDYCEEMGTGNYDLLSLKEYFRFVDMFGADGDIKAYIARYDNAYCEDGLFMAIQGTIIDLANKYIATDGKEKEFSNVLSDLVADIYVKFKDYGASTFPIKK
ncbi:MAG: hypothetical protein MJ237_06035 [bacterium]|nr:hypothetical protein [bacterium]